jgi:hypothetical protein
MAIRTLKLNLLVVEYSAHNFMGDDRSQHNDQRSDPRG